MSPLEIKEERQQRIDEFKALKSLFGNMLLNNNVSIVLTESKDKPSTNDLDYMTRKFKESQSFLKR